MDTSPDLGLPYVASQQGQPEVTHNEALNLLQILSTGVLDRGVNAPPGSPAEGDCYIIGSAPTGAWSGKANKLTGFFGGAWRFVPDLDSDGSDIAIGARHEGLGVWVRDEDVPYVWTGSAWKAIYLQGSAAWDPASIPAGEAVTQNVTVTGAALGDFAVGSFSLDIPGLMIAAHVSAADTVTVTLFNPSGGSPASVDIGNGTVRARVWKL